MRETIIKRVTVTETIEIKEEPENRVFYLDVDPSYYKCPVGEYYDEETRQCVR